MRMTPVKTQTAFRGIWVRFLLWETVIRMKELHGNPDVWFTETRSPRDGSPWEQTRAYGNGCGPLGPGSVIHVVEAETLLRLYAMHDFFAGLRWAARTRRVYSLYVMCRSTIEACAFAAWVFDPRVEPEERILRGLLLRKESLARPAQSLKRELGDARITDKADQGYLLDVKRAEGDAEALLVECERAVQQTQSDLQIRTKQVSVAPPSLPSKTQRVRDMFLEDIDLPQGSDAYHRLSGVAHSDALAISDIWNLSRERPSVDYFDFLTYLHLAVCSIDFSLRRRALCWGDSYKGVRLQKTIEGLEHIIAGEPDAPFL